MSEEQTKPTGVAALLNQVKQQPEETKNALDGTVDDTMVTATPGSPDTVAEAQVQKAPGYYSQFAGVITAGNNKRYDWPMTAPFNMAQVDEGHKKQVQAKLDSMVDRGLADLVEA